MRVCVLMGLFVPILLDVFARLRLRDFLRCLLCLIPVLLFNDFLILGEIGHARLIKSMTLRARARCRLC